MAEKIYELNKAAETPAGRGKRQEEWEKINQIWEKQIAAAEEIKDDACDCFEKLIKELLSAKENSLLSPSTLLLAFLLLSSVTNGSTKKEILNAVGVKEGKEQRFHSKIKEIICMETQQTKSTLANSLWINELADIKKENLKQICEAFDAEAFSGKMGEEDIDIPLRKWINDNTGNLLEKETAEIKTKRETVMELITAAYFRSNWKKEFFEEQTKKGRFYLNKDKYILTEYMNEREDMDVYFGNKFMAVKKPLLHGYSMIFALPGEDYELTQAIKDEELISFIAGRKNIEEKRYNVEFSVPKFDVSTKSDIADIMQKMGISSIFDHRKADFSAVCDDKRLCLTKAEHASRLKIDEKGAEAAAYVEFGIELMCMPPRLENIKFRLDKPFVFALMKEDKMPLFVGTIIDPREN